MFRCIFERFRRTDRNIFYAGTKVNNKSYCKFNKLFEVASCRLPLKFKLRVDLFFKLRVSEPKRERDFKDLGGVADDFRLTISPDCERTGLVTILKLNANASSDLNASQ